jgi:starch phosphorylase
MQDETHYPWAKSTTIEALKQSFEFHLKYSLADDRLSATNMDLYHSLALSVRDRLIDKWLQTQHQYYDQDAKRVYYLSMEFLVGRWLTNSLINLGFYDEFQQALNDLGLDLDTLEKMEIEAGLGNGGLGRLASCFMESMSTLGIPALGYGIRYEFGIFYQKIKDGYQIESADKWLRRGSPWEVPRPRFLYPVRFNGHVETSQNGNGERAATWVNSTEILAMPYDFPVPGYKNQIVNNFRLWSARATNELDLNYFNVGDYIQALKDKQETEIISKVLYPNDSIEQGKELRLKQEYFFVSASLQDIIRRFKKTHTDFAALPDKVAIQLNDTHPSLAIAELMRILIDENKIPWKKAWDITVKTFGFTNHTTLPEALEKWAVDLLGRLLPRHLQIIYEINSQFLEQVKKQFPGDHERLRRMSLIEEGFVKSVRMAHLAIVGSHSTNGVAEIHSNILKDEVFSDFNDMFPTRFKNITNGITQRRWLKTCNPSLSKLITEEVGDGWATNLWELEKLTPKADDSEFQERWRKSKQINKDNLTDYIHKKLRIQIRPDSLFDVQIKRIHEYKRQLLNVLHTVYLYNQIKKDPGGVSVPRTKIFAGKAAPAYSMAKLIIKLINSVGQKINNDPDVSDHLKIVFIPNYSVKVAEKIIPAANLSEQISTAGMEASGTGNMKLALNGALTIGTLDGANIEIKREVGDENIFIFGLTAEEVKEKLPTYNARAYYQNNEDIREILDQIGNGFFSPENPELFSPVINYFLNENDGYLLLADFESYIQCHERVAQEYQNVELWTRKSILNAANMGFFSSDRSITEYARDIWNVDSRNGLTLPTPTK